MKKGFLCNLAAIQVEILWEKIKERLRGLHRHNLFIALKFSGKWLRVYAATPL